MAEPATKMGAEGAPSNTTDEPTAEPVTATAEESVPAELAAFPISVQTLHGGTVVELHVSPLDTVQDVRQYLFETPEAADLTSYALLLDGQPINDFAELSEMDNLKPDSVVVMAPTAYNKRTALLHIRRLREIMSFHLVNFANTSSPSLFSHYCSPDDDDESMPSPNKSSSSQRQPISKGKKIADAGAQKKAPSHEKRSATHNGKNIDSSAANVVNELHAISLANFYPPHSSPPEHELQCVKSIEFAGWNPPPGNRTLLGDLFYLQITTLEGQTVFITSWTHGFYVNRCTEAVFNPKPATTSYASHNLSDVLSQKHFQQVLRSGQFGRHPFELMAVPIPLTPWVGIDVPHTNDKNRSEYAVLYTEMDFAGNLRDWNEEYQAAKELPCSTVQERIIRDRAIIKIHNDFVDAATRGAMSIASQAVPPINPHEEPRMHLFVYNNIFFSFCHDHRDPDFEPLQPPSQTDDQPLADEIKDKYAEQATYVSANNDLKGLRLYNDADVSGLGTVLTAVIDYRGFRLLAQSLIPGVLQREETKLAYGSMDNGKTVFADPQFHELMKNAALNLHIKEHEVVDSSGNIAKLASPINAKGIVGTDGRKYLIDLGRVMPLDTNWCDEQSSTTQLDAYQIGEKSLILHPSSEPLLRPELVTVFCDALELRLQHQGGDNLIIQLKEESGGEESTKNTSIDLSSAVLVLQSDSAINQQPTKSADEVAHKSDAHTVEEDKNERKPEERNTNENKRYVITINPNVLHHNPGFKLTAPKEEIEKDESLVKTLSIFLKESILPRMAEEFTHLLATPVDGQTLTSIMHRNGINMRYLGSLAQLCQSRPFLVRLCEQEMLVRAAKYELNRYLREVEDHLLGLAICHFLNCLFGDSKALPEKMNIHSFDDEPAAERKKDTAQANGGGTKSKKQKRKNGEEMSANMNVLPKLKIFSLTSHSLWLSLQQLVLKRFRYNISLKGGSAISRSLSDGDSLNTRQRLRSLPAVRAFCQKAGIQILARDYALHENTPFKRRDILDLFPNVKHLNPKTKDGQQLLDAGKVFLSQGRLDIAFELFNEALAIFHQVYGPLHPDTALCYGNLAMVHYHANDTVQAISHQKKMVIINERVHGLDHHDTAHSYGNLALFTRDLKKDSLIPTALKCLQRAHYLASLVCGPQHPDAPNTLMHLGTMYQDLGNAEIALNYYQEALKSNQYFFGSVENLQTAQICHCIALAHSTLDNFKEALNWEKKNYTILNKLFGDKDFRTTESNIWLKQFTRKAVQMQIEAKKAQRDLTSNLTQEKFEKLTKQAGKASVQTTHPTPPKPAFKISTKY